MDTALVTGGAGFLGSHVAERLVQRGCEVVVVDDLSGGFRRNLPEGARFERSSILDPAAINALFAEYRFRWVYHLAAYAAEGLSPFIRRFNYRVNVEGSVNLINAAVNHDTECFVFTSSIAVYGAAGGLCTEATPPRPVDPYGIAKLAVEQDLRAAAEQFGLRHVIFRPHNVYGERQNLADPYRNVIGIFINQVRSGRPCTIFGDGSQTRAFSWIGDVAPRIADCVGLPAALDRTFNVGADETQSLNALASAVQRAVGCEVGVEYLPARHEVMHASCDHTLADDVFGRQTPTELATGLERMVRWAETVEIASPRAVAPVEIKRGLPPSWERYARRPSPVDED